jgi:GTP-binding protein
LPPPSREEINELFTLEEKSDQKYTIERLPDGTYFVDGGLVDFLIQNVTISDTDSFAFFQKVLKDRGVMHDLRKMGIKEGDVVSIGDIEFEWYD